MMRVTIDNPKIEEYFNHSSKKVKEFLEKSIENNIKNESISNREDEINLINAQVESMKSTWDNEEDEFWNEL